MEKILFIISHEWSLSYSGIFTVILVDGKFMLLCTVHLYVTAQELS